MKQVILVGEMKIDDGIVHQQDLASCLEVERIVTWPKDTNDVQVIVGKLLAGRRTALLVRAEKASLPVTTVDSKLTPEVTLRAHVCVR